MNNLEISLEFDEKGYFDRECPNDDCLYQFKILGNDYNEKLKEEVLYCPQCGYKAENDMWNTQEQNKEIEERIKNYSLNLISGEMNKMFENLEKSTRRNKNVKVRYKPSRINKFFNVPVPALQQFNTELECKECGIHYCVIGVAYYCPSCGLNPITNIFEKEFDRIRKKIENVDNITKYYEEIGDKDSAYNLERDLIESSVRDVVSIYQKLLHTIFEENSTKKVRLNDFQILEKSHKLYFDNFEVDIFKNITKIERNFIEEMFQNRHILEHNKGFIDEKYVERVIDSNTIEGQRKIIKKNDVLKFHSIIEKVTIEVIKIGKNY